MENVLEITLRRLLHLRLSHAEFDHSSAPEKASLAAGCAQLSALFMKSLSVAVTLDSVLRDNLRTTTSTRCSL